MVATFTTKAAKVKWHQNWLFDFWLSVGWSKCNDKSGVEITVTNLITTGVAKTKWNWLVAFCIITGLFASSLSKC